ncbi:MAG: response regulator [Gammaproteobacteria bacterium]|nr:response regulator [Gammaproteobacteria bacterium]
MKNKIRTLSGSVILLVEDNPMNQEIILGLLDGSGIHVDVVSNGQEAVDKFKASPDKYELILMDLQMPVLDGLQATKQIKALGAQLPIIALTANAMLEDVEQSRQAGMVKHLSKPIDVEQLYMTLLEYLAIKSEIDEKQIINEVDDQIIVPTFEVIDANKGLKSLAGNKKVYLNILKDFLASYKDLNLENMDQENFKRTTHTIKGMSASIGANALHNISKQLDETQDKALLPEFNKQLSLVMNELEQSNLDMVNQPHKNKIEISSNDKEVLFNQLHKALNIMAYNQCEAILEEINQYQLSDKESEMLQKVSELIEEFDFEQADAVLTYP